jgi:hypothetical protein
MPVATEDDVQQLFEMGLRLSERDLGRSRYEDYVRDLADHFFYISAIHPEHFRSLQEAVVAVPDERLRNFDLTFATWLYLMQDAPDACVDSLMRRLTRSGQIPPMAEFDLEQILAGICTPAALEALAAYAEKSDKREEFQNQGFWIPPEAYQAVPRFTRERRAVRVERFDGNVDELESVTHPVGLPLSTIVADPSQDTIVWHYCSFALADIAGLPPVPAKRLHLVSPPLNSDWTLFCKVAPGDRYAEPTLVTSNETETEEMSDMRAEAQERASEDTGHLTLLPYDDQLVYRNGHTELTLGVVGDVGGPPIGLYPNPSCPNCGKLLFHVATVTKDVREYGDGFRSLFVCEDCQIAASHATMWN